MQSEIEFFGALTDSIRSFLFWLWRQSTHGEKKTTGQAHDLKQERNEVCPIRYGSPLHPISRVDIMKLSLSNISQITKVVLFWRHFIIFHKKTLKRCWSWQYGRLCFIDHHLRSSGSRRWYSLSGEGWLLLFFKVLRKFLGSWKGEASWSGLLYTLSSVQSGCWLAAHNWGCKPILFGRGERYLLPRLFFSSTLTLDVTIFSKTDPGVMFRAD